MTAEQLAEHVHNTPVLVVQRRTPYEVDMVELEHVQLSDGRTHTRVKPTAE